jgi:hypothetical protein
MTIFSESTQDPIDSVDPRMANAQRFSTGTNETKKSLRLLVPHIPTRLRLEAADRTTGKTPAHTSTRHARLDVPTAVPPRNLALSGMAQCAPFTLHHHGAAATVSSTGS